MKTIAILIGFDKLPSVAYPASMKPLLTALLLTAVLLAQPAQLKPPQPFSTAYDGAVWRIKNLSSQSIVAWYMIDSTRSNVVVKICPKPIPPGKSQGYYNMTQTQTPEGVLFSDGSVWGANKWHLEAHYHAHQIFMGMEPGTFVFSAVPANERGTATVPGHLGTSGRTVARWGKITAYAATEITGGLQ